MATKKYAGFGERLAAAIIDAIIMTVAVAMLNNTMPFLRRPLLNMLSGALYSILLWVNWNGQTLGKKAMGIKVVQENGKPLDYQSAIIRYLSYIISAIPLCLGYFWIIWDEKKQGWHDRIAKTLVVKI